MRSGPARFPFELLNSFGTESADITLADTTEQMLFKTLFSVEQHIDQHEAYLHIEKHWLLRDIHTLQAEDFITLAKEINARAGRALISVKDENGKAGEYLKHFITVNHSTTLPDVEFAMSPIYSQENYDILHHVYGEAVADDYRNFIFFVEIEFKTYQFVSDSQESMKTWYNIIESQQGTPGARAFSRILRIINPDHVPQKMQAFADTLVKKIKSGASPIECAAFSLASLAANHAFAHANSRTARIFKNTILMMMGHPCIIIPASAAEEYYIALSHSLGTDKKRFQLIFIM